MRKRLTECLFMLGLGLGVPLCTLAARPGQAAQFTNPVQGFTVTYPDTWNARSPHDRGVVLRNFPPEHTPEGGTIPDGGAIINVQAFPPYDNPYFPQGRDDYSALDYLASNETVIAQTSPSSRQPARVTFTDGLNLRDVWTVRHLGGRTFLLSLTCAAGDPQIPGYEQIFDSVVASISLTSITPSPTTPTP